MGVPPIPRADGDMFQRLFIRSVTASTAAGWGYESRPSDDLSASITFLAAFDIRALHKSSNPDSRPYCRRVSFTVKGKSSTTKEPNLKTASRYEPRNLAGGRGLWQVEMTFLSSMVLLRYKVCGKDGCQNGKSATYFRDPSSRIKDPGR